MSMEYEAVAGVPSGLIACRLGNAEAHILRISPRALWLRIDGSFPDGAPLVLSFFHIKEGNYSHLAVNYSRTEALRRENCGTELRLSISDADYAAAVRRALSELADYIRWRCEGGTDCSSPADADFCTSLEQQYAEWFGSGAPIISDPQGREIALTLRDPEMWSAFLQRRDASLWTFYAQNRNVPRSLFPREEPRRLYIGSASCPQLFPELTRLAELLDAAADGGLSVTLLLPPLRAGFSAQADALLRLLADRSHTIELAVNDWGMLEFAAMRPDCAELTLGPLLNKLRQDPRMARKPGAVQQHALFSKNSLNDPAFRSFLGELGIRRFEYEACGRELCIPEGRHSLHLPFCHTNVSAWCTLKAYCETGRRGAQGPVDGCPRWCMQNAFLYPRQLKLIGRGNALQMLIRSTEAPLPPQIDRLVFNL